MSNFVFMKSKLILLIIFIGLRSSFVGQAQYEFNGRIMQKNASEIPFAQIQLLHSDQLVVADLEGKFHFISNQKEEEVFVKSIGFKNVKTKLHSLSQNRIVLEENNQYLDEFVISGTLEQIQQKNSPISIEVYSANFINKIPSSNLIDVTDQMAGIRPQINCAVCNTGDIHINGMEGSYSMIVIDGMPVMGGLASVYGLQGIPTSIIHQLEVVKGPSSTLYGSEAMAGLINVITKNVDCLPKVSIDFMASSWGEIQTSLLVKTINNKRIKSFLTFDIFDYSNPIDNNADGFTDLSLRKRYTFFNKMNFYSLKNPNNPFKLSLRFMNENRWGGQMDWNESFRGSNQLYGESILTDRVEVGTSYRFPTKERLTWNSSYSWHKQKSWYGNNTYNALQVIGFSQFTWRKKWNEKFNLLSGLALRYNYYDDNTPATTNENSWWLPGAFLQTQFKWNTDHQLLLGWRTDLHTIHGAIHSPRLNYQLNLSDQTVMRLGVGNGFRVVNVFTEDHAALTGAREIIFREALDPERSRNINLNISTDRKSEWGKLHLESSLFYSHFSNKIIPNYELNDNQIIYSNLDGYSISKGIGIQVGYDFHKVPFKMNFNGTILDVGIITIDEENNHVKTQQLLSEQNSLKWNLSYHFSSININLDYTASRYGPIRLPLLENDFRPAYSLPYAIHHLKLTKHFNKGRSIFLGVRNLFDFTPPSYSILRAHDPFDQQVNDPIDNPNNYTFDASYVYASFQGINFIFGGKIVF